MDRVPDRLPLFRPLPGIRVHGQYLALHLVILALFVAVPFRMPKGTSALELAGYLVLSAMLVTVSAIDIALYRLPDRIVLPTLAVSVAIVVISSLIDGQPERIRFALAGAGLYFGFLFLAHLVHPRGMGFGDVKLAAVMGLYVGWIGGNYVQAIALVLWAMMVGFVLGSVGGIVMLVLRKKSKPIPFGPFLAIGTLVVVLAGSGLVVAN